MAGGKATKTKSQFPKPQEGKALSGKQLSTARKFISSGDKVLNDSGTSGKAFAKHMRQQQLQYDLEVGKANKFTSDTFRGLSKQERENVTDVLEGLAQPITDKAKAAAQRMRAFYDNAANRADKAGLDIIDQAKNKKDFTPRKNYSPRQYDWQSFRSGAKRDEAIQHLVDTGQAVDEKDAAVKLDQMIKDNTERRTSNLEHQRVTDLPGYEKDAEVVARKYAEDASKRFTEVEAFGKKDEFAKMIMNDIAREGGDAEEAKKIFEYMYKGLPQSKFADLATQYNLITKLDLSAITNLAQGVNTITKAGLIKTAKAVVKGFTKEGKDLAELANVYDDMVAIKETGVNPGKIVSFVMYPFSKIEKFNRRTAAVAGKLHAESLTKKLKKTPNNEYAWRQLESLGLDPQKLIKGDLTPEELIIAANKMSEKTQFKPNVLNTPRLWKTPLGRVAMQFKSFTFMQTRFITDEVLKEARKGNLLPMARFLAVVPVASALRYEAYNKMTGREPDKENMAVDVRTMDATMKAAGSFYTEPIAQGAFLKDTYENDYNTPLKKATRTASTFLGPTVGTAGNIANAGVEYAKGDPLLAQREAVGNVPFVGEYVKNKKYPFPESDTPDYTNPFIVSDDAPKTNLGQMATNAASFVSNPITTAKLLHEGEPIRKMRYSGDNILEKAWNIGDAITVTERRKGNDKLDGGDKTTDVDHIIPKWLGGRENAENLQNLDTKEHEVKTAMDAKLRAQFEAGDITKAEAKQALLDLNATMSGKLVDAPLSRDLKFQKEAQKEYAYKKVTKLQTKEYKDAINRLKEIPTWAGEPAEVKEAVEKELKEKASLKVKADLIQKNVQKLKTPEEQEEYLKALDDLNILTKKVLKYMEENK